MVSQTLLYKAKPHPCLCKRARKPNGQIRMENPEKLATWNGSLRICITDFIAI